MGFDAKASDLLARVASVPDVGPMTALTSAFTLANGQTSDAAFLGSNWVVYRVMDHQQPNPADLTGKTKGDIEQQLLDGKREMAFSAPAAAILYPSMNFHHRLAFGSERLNSSSPGYVRNQRVIAGNLRLRASMGE